MTGSYMKSVEILILIRYLNEEEASETITSDILKELDDLEKESIPRSSLKQMNNEISRLKTFLSGKKLSTEILKVPTSILDIYLRFYYSSLRTKDGRFYAPKPLICIRASIHRYFQLNRPSVNIIEDSMFTLSNRMLKNDGCQVQDIRSEAFRKLPCH